MGVQHTLWIFDMAGANSQFKDRGEVLKIINGLFLANCNAGIDSATARWVASNAIIAPGKFDAVVFVIDDIRHSLVKKLGGSTDRASKNSTVLGTTLLGATGGGLAEVYWDRCVNNSEIAGAIFHEAAHLKSEQDESMHTAKEVRILSAKGGQHQHPSWGDLEFYEAAIKRAITLRTKVP